MTDPSSHTEEINKALVDHRKKIDQLKEKYVELSQNNGVSTVIFFV